LKLTFDPLHMLQPRKPEPKVEENKPGVLTKEMLIEAIELMKPDQRARLSQHIVDRQQMMVQPIINFNGLIPRRGEYT
jgi:hypothetical protein